MTLAMASAGRWWEPTRIVGTVSGRSSDGEFLAAVAAQIRDTPPGAPSDPSTPSTPSTPSAPSAPSAPSDPSDPSPSGLPVAFGVVGFEPDSRATFHLTAGMVEGPPGAPRSSQLDPRADHAPTVVSLRPRPSADDYSRTVAAALDRIAREGGDRKIVLGRWQDVTMSAPLQPAELAARLHARNPASVVLALPLADPRAQPATLVAATPELLIARRGDRILSRPLAGSVPRASDPGEDKERGRRLLADAKNLREHAFVVRAIADALGPLCDEFRVPAAPCLIGTDSMWHLASPIAGRLSPQATKEWDALRLARLLHPTPAVAGTPRTWAMDAISELEESPRGPFTGAAGWVDAVGDGAFHVVIRAAVVQGVSVRLFAGAGIVDGSIPAEEAAETGAKMMTVMRALGGAK
ncbi:isochorismate synthase [Rarobacter incanus]|uniref:isochorismate synthase n=1 Tax=Rarobacter incanus TaxID=153494 RepID=A0A542SPL9_9MICO|nr:isochorismate synthase [Rarobacter incanus]TQK76560.1 isochorismate synthase [Rarobacter incanus]